MAGKLSPATQLKLNELREFLDLVQRAHGLVEQYATARVHPEQYENAIRRVFDQLKLKFMGAGYDALSQLAGSMVMAIRRSGSSVSKSRVLREGVGNMRFQLELESRTLVAADQAEQEKKRATES